MHHQSIRILFLCTGNSCRSQMAEGLARWLGNGKIAAFSAGTHPRSVNPLTVAVMSELGIDISRQSSKSLDQLLSEPFAFVITVCDKARELCPVWAGTCEQIEWLFDDPAEASGTMEKRLAAFRRVRNETKRRLDLFILANLRTGTP